MYIKSILYNNRFQKKGKLKVPIKQYLQKNLEIQKQLPGGVLQKRQRFCYICGKTPVSESLF